MLLPTGLAIIALFASLVLLVTGNAMLGTIAALRLEIDGFDPGVTGVVLAVTSLGFVLGSFQGVRIVQRVGHIRAFAAFSAVAAAAALAHSLHVVSHCVGIAPVSTAVIMELDPRRTG